MQNHLTYEQLALYSEHLKSNTLEQCPQDLKKHIESCDRCAVEAAELCTLTDDLTVQTNSKKSLFGKQGYLFVLAAAAAGVLMFVAIWFLVDTSDSNRNYLGENNPAGLIDTGNIQIKPKVVPAEKKRRDTNVSPQPEDSSKKTEVMFGQSVPNRIDETSTVSKYYRKHKPSEMLVENFNGNMRSTHVEVHTPSELSVTNDGEQLVLLRWNNTQKMHLTVELLNNSGEIHKEYRTRGDSLIIENLPHKGLYYWKLFNQDFDLLFCGKIHYR
jgi:hypothetical protein